MASLVRDRLKFLDEFRCFLGGCMMSTLVHMFKIYTDAEDFKQKYIVSEAILNEGQ